APRGLEALEIDALDVAPNPGARVVDQRLRIAQVGSNSIESLRDRIRIRHVTRVRSGIAELFCELARETGAACKQRDPHALARERSRERRAVPFADANYHAYGPTHVASFP